MSSRSSVRSSVPSSGPSSGPSSLFLLSVSSEKKKTDSSSENDRQTDTPLESGTALHEQEPYDPLTATALAHTLPDASRSSCPKLSLGPDAATPPVVAKAGTSSSLGEIDSTPPAEVEGYEIRQQLGRGAFGTVWLGVQKNTGKQVAIKFYAHSDGLDLHLLRREVESLAFLYTERDVVQLLAVGWEHDPPFYVMEYLPHGSLEDRLRNGPLPISEAVHVAKVVARALGNAHGRGILHCDLKPANVLFDGNGKPRLCDFGQARLSTDQKPSLGTFFYMAPEQADLLAVPDARWDVYALGAILYAMLTGAPPYRDGPLEPLLRRASTLPERLRVYRQFLLCSTPPDPRHHRRGVDPALRQIVTRCLAADPSARYPNVQAVLSAMERRARVQQRRPVFLLGAIGPAVLIVVTALMATKSVRVAMKSSNEAVTQRAREASEFAARFVAETAGREIDRRWSVLEQAALDATLRAELRNLSQTEAKTTVGLQRFIEAQSQQNRDLAAASWFVTTAGGVQVARFPVSDTIGRSWAFRDYFHGLGHDFPRDTPPSQIAPIKRPHRSSVFLSGATKHRLVAFSVPIWSDVPPKRVIGVLGMTVELGGFGELRPGSGNTERQIAVLVDGREDWTGQKGLILQHPHLASLRALQKPLPHFHLDQERVHTLTKLREHLRDHKPLPIENLFVSDYRDPTSEHSSEKWIMTMRPVLARGSDTGWVVLVQERLSDITEPVSALGRSLMRIGMVGLLMMTVVWLLLFWRVSRTLSGRSTKT